MEKPILAAMLSCQGTKLSDTEKKLFSQYNPLGISLFSRNIESKEQLQKLIKEIRETIGRDDVLIAADQEGGRVRRLAEPDYRSYAAQEHLGRLEKGIGKEAAERAIRLHAGLTAADLKETGLNMNYAPVLDIAFDETSPVLKSRCFGSDELKTAEYGRLMTETYIKCGICPCIKHMPGHGRAACDPHLELPILNYSLKELEKDFYPFRMLNDAPAGMTAHIVIPAVDGTAPVTQSKKAIDTVIRGLIGFDGFLISDSIDMQALKGSAAEKTTKALDAGCDAVCYCFGDSREMLEICRLGRNLADKSMIRFEKIKKIFQNDGKVADIDKAAEQYSDLIGRVEKYADSYDATEVLNKMQKNNRGGR